MSAAEVARRKALYAHARERRSGQGEAYALLRAAVHDELAHELCMRKATADLRAAQDRVMRDCKTLRETMKFDPVAQRLEHPPVERVTGVRLPAGSPSFGDAR